ncbi:MAG: FtsW/RodA/SpoVE family cell cycle protein, partial [Verrucomicrobiia bacterium]
SVFGVAAIYSATFMREGQWAFLKTFWVRQSIWVSLGLVVYLAMSLIDYRWIKEQSGAVVVYLIGLLLLVAVDLGGSVRSGAQSWLQLGPIDLQPSQVALLGGILLLAVALSETGPTRNPISPLWRVMIAGVMVAGPFVLILKQPDLGSALVWVPVFLLMLYVGGVPKRWLLLLIIVGAGICAPLAIAFVLKPYQIDRLLVFRDPEADPLDTGYAILQSMTAIGSAGVEGRGWLSPETQNAKGFIPITTAHNDYLFTVLAEQLGLVGTLILVMILTVLLLTILYIGLRSDDHMGALIASGVAATLFAHIFLNAGMTVSLVPITGLPLPLLSYGGTFAIIVLLMLGIVQSIWIHRDRRF